MNITSNKNKLVSNGGFSLIEALVAFMIISVGMLGIASLQTISMKAGHTAVTRTSAVYKHDTATEEHANIHINNTNK